MVVQMVSIHEFARHVAANKDKQYVFGSSPVNEQDHTLPKLRNRLISKQPCFHHLSMNRITRRQIWCEVANKTKAMFLNNSHYVRTNNSQNCQCSIQWPNQLPRYFQMNSLHSLNAHCSLGFGFNKQGRHTSKTYNPK